MFIDIVTIEQPAYTQVLTTEARGIQFPLGIEDKKLIEAMKNKLEQLGGVGLAAPQVNQAKKIIALYIPEDASLLRDNVMSYPMHVMINPSFEPVKNTEIAEDFEACYSVSSKSGKVPRYKEIKISYYDEEGQYHQQTERGFYARVLQHEIDHINGILITDRLTPECVQGTIEEMSKLRRAQLSEEKKVLFDALMKKKFK